MRVSEDKLQPDFVFLAGQHLLVPTHLHQGGYGGRRFARADVTTDQRRDTQRVRAQDGDTATTGVLYPSSNSSPALAFRCPRGKSPTSELHRARDSRRTPSIRTVPLPHWMNLSGVGPSHVLATGLFLCLGVTCFHEQDRLPEVQLPPSNHSILGTTGPGAGRAW
jgi:hypothetical protein